MNSLIINQYIKNQKDLDCINEWVISNYKNEYFNVSTMNELGTRFTTRQCTNRKKDHLFDYPKVFYKIQNKLCKDFNLEKYNKALIGKNGIVTGIGFEGDYISEHVDPIWFDNTQTYHFNFITKKPVTGGITVINNHPHEIFPGDLLIYNVSKCSHYVTKTFGNIPRILCVFGFCIENKDINDIFKKFRKS